MTSTSMCCFHIPATVATETTGATRYVVITMSKNTKAIGKTALNAETILKLKCMFITGQMSITLKNLKILQNMNLLDVHSVVL